LTLPGFPIQAERRVKKMEEDGYTNLERPQKGEGA